MAPRDFDDEFFFLQKYKSYHNHELDVHLAKSDLWTEVPVTVRAGKFCVIPPAWKLLGHVFNEAKRQISDS